MEELLRNVVPVEKYFQISSNDFEPFNYSEIRYAFVYI